MHLNATARELYRAISVMPVIDAHQHLPPEADYLAFEYSGPNMFAGGYIQHDLKSAGADPAFIATLRDGGDRPVEDWWPRIRPYWEHVRHTSFSRALCITARDLWGIEDICDATIGALAERVKADNTPGLYRRALQDTCNAERSITCVDQAAFPHDPALVGLAMLDRIQPGPTGTHARMVERAGRELTSLDDAIAAQEEQLRRMAADGAVGFKTRSNPHGTPDEAAAAREFKAAMAEPETAVPTGALCDVLFHKALDVAAEANLPVAVHAGFWGDFRQLDPKHMLDFALARDDVRFDLFHLGMPMVRDAILIGKNLPNVTLNLTWCPVISGRQTAQALIEIVDQVPLNKVIAFGGDYRASVQKTYGHLVIAREAVAVALGHHVDAGAFDPPRALHIARLWFHENPKRIYGLG